MGITRQNVYLFLISREDPSLFQKRNRLIGPSVRAGDLTAEVAATGVTMPGLSPRIGFPRRYPGAEIRLVARIGMGTTCPVA